MQPDHAWLIAPLERHQADDNKPPAAVSEQHRNAGYPAQHPSLTQPWRAYGPGVAAYGHLT
jgi:hypothetical protein